MTDSSKLITIKDFSRLKNCDVKTVKRYLDYFKLEIIGHHRFIVLDRIAEEWAPMASMKRKNPGKKKDAL